MEILETNLPVQGKLPAELNGAYMWVQKYEHLRKLTSTYIWGQRRLLIYPIAVACVLKSRLSKADLSLFMLTDEKIWWNRRKKEMQTVSCCLPWAISLQCE